jgi:hypothetical protein
VFRRNVSPPNSERSEVETRCGLVGTYQSLVVTYHLNLRGEVRL